MYTSRTKVNMSRLIYRLKHEMGEPISWVHTLSAEVNIDSGMMEKETETSYIHRAIVLPLELIKKAKYSLTYLAGNKNFVYESFYSGKEIGVILDLRDTKLREFSQCLEDSLILQDGKSYNIKNIDFGAFNSYLIIELKEVANG